MKHAAILTAIYDSYDTLKPVLYQEGVDVEWICVTDDPNLHAPGWLVVYEPHPELHPNRAAKRPKMLPWEYTDAPSSVWIDASYRVVSPSFVSDVLAYASPIAQFVHPWRGCLYSEAEESARLRKYDGEPCLEQVASYRDEEFPVNQGLWATGVIARHHTSQIRFMSEVWHSEIQRWSFQDQLSHPYALWTAGLRPTSLPGTHLANRWLAYEGSGRH